MEKETTQLLLRIPVDLKAELQKRADEQGRKLTQEINIRLRNSLPARGPTLQGILAREAEAKSQPYATVVHINEKSPAGTLSSTDQAMLEVFRAMPVEKQLALLSLFR